MKLYLGEEPQPCFILIDDQKTELKNLQRAVRMLYPKAKILAFESGECFWDYWEENQKCHLGVKAVFLESNLPGMSGLDVLTFLKKNLLISAEVYLFSSQLDVITKNLSLALGATDCLRKPEGYVRMLRLLRQLGKNRT